MQGFDSLTQLFVAVVLQEEMYFCAITVAFGAVLGIVGEPVGVVFAETLEIFAVFQCFPLLLKGDLEIFPFGFQYLGVIDEIGFIELGSCPLESPQLFKVQIYRIQRKSRDGIIRVGVAPVIVCRRVVDGQDLNDFQSIGKAPIA